MSSPFVAEIRIFACNFAPTGWATCNGQLLPISQNTALFALLGTFYGGDGKSTFALPNLQGSVALNQGTSTTGTDYFLGQSSGVQFVTLLQTEMPAHTHTVMASTSTANRTAPISNSFARTASGATPYIPDSPAPPLVPMSIQALQPTGGSQPHTNQQPYLVLNFIIALQGIFPSRN